MREELHDRLEQMVLDVEDVIDNSSMAEESQETLETDELFKSKFKSFVDQYELRELHFQATLRQRDLEILAHIAMLEQQRKTQEMESSKSHQLTRQVSTFSQTETELRSQLNIYVEKFKQVWLSKVGALFAISHHYSFPAYIQCHKNNADTL